MKITIIKYKIHIIMSIIGLSGYKGSGKDTVADYLVENHGYIKVAFADFLKNALKELFNWNDDNFNQNNKEKIDPYWGVTPRKMCQEMGTEFLRIYCKSFISLDFNLPNGDPYKSTFHIKRINQEVIKLLNAKANIIFSDVRFQDELDYIKKIGGSIIRISRDSVKDNEFSQHVSETNIKELNNVDYDISNHETIPLLFKKINLTVECIEESLHLS